jgi:hypothetical protein
MVQPIEAEAVDALANIERALTLFNFTSGAQQLHILLLGAQKRVLPADHPDIAQGMRNMAATYYALGRHQDAL